MVLTLLRTIKNDLISAFYLPHTRFWELLSGSLIAWINVHKTNFFVLFGIKKIAFFNFISDIINHTKNILINAMSFSGLLLLCYGFFEFNKSLEFPGWFAIVPVFGTMLIISSNPKSLVNRIILSNNLIVWFGLISFPLYLWHWPLLVFSNLIETELSSNFIHAIAVTISVVLAWATYRFIECHVRFNGYSNTKIAILFILMVGTCCVGYNTYDKNGLSFRFPEFVQKLTGYKYDYVSGYRYRTCFLDVDQDYRSFSNCIPEGNIKDKTIFLWGDSYAAHLYPGYKAIYGDSYTIVQRTTSGCPPINDLDIAGRVNCKRINDENLLLIINSKPTRVVLAAKWTAYSLIKLEDTIIKLKKLGVKNIDLIGPFPHWTDMLPKLLYSYFKKNIPHVIPYRMSFGLNLDFAKLDEILRKKTLKLGINYISPKDILCNTDGCITRVGDSIETLITSDYGHLTKAGSEFTVSRFPNF